MIVATCGYTVRQPTGGSIRRAMNESDTDANMGHRQPTQLRNRQILGAEDREVERYDKSMALYEKASIKTYTPLAVLNSGQAVIFTVALTICLIMAANDVLTEIDRRSLGDGESLMLQLSCRSTSRAWSAAKSNRV
jgi:ATP-binding cassette subfamily B protein